MSLSARRISGFLLILTIIFQPRCATPESIKLQREGSTYLVPVRINDAITLKFLLDTGASEVTIPEDVFLTLVRTGTIRQEDFLGEEKYVLADGSEQTSKRFLLHKLQVGDHILRNVVADVTSVQSVYPLLGQSFLSKLSAWSIDNEQGVLILSDRNEPVESATSDPLEIVRAFYTALSRADGSQASTYVIPEKRLNGPFSPAELSRFYGSLSEPLRLSEVKLSAPEVAMAEYNYVLPDGRHCEGKSLVYLTIRGSETLIERIRALAGC